MISFTWSSVENRDVVRAPRMETWHIVVSYVLKSLTIQSEEKLDIPKHGVTLSGHCLAKLATLTWSSSLVAIAQMCVFRSAIAEAEISLSVGWQCASITCLRTSSGGRGWCDMVAVGPFGKASTKVIEGEEAAIAKIGEMTSSRNTQDFHI